MLEGLLRLFQPRPIGLVIRDVLDLLIVAYVIYRALLVLRGTRAMQMGVGLGIVFLVYWGARVLGLVTLHNLLSSLLSSIILIVVVVFQNDIRRALIRMGGQSWFRGGREQQSRVIDEVVAAATELARHRMGALIAFEQDANVLEFVKSEGIVLESVVSRELLVALFVPEGTNKLHDGAVLIRDLKIARAGVFFPMPETKILDASLGSRHRAALGITEETDAVVVVVSEERGTISFCFSGNIVSNLDAQSLRHALLGLFGRSSRKKRFARKVPAPAAAPARTTTLAGAPRTSIVGSPPPAPSPAAATAGGTPAPASVGKPASAKIATSTPMRQSSSDLSGAASGGPPAPRTRADSRADPQEAAAGGAPSSPTPTPRPATFVPVTTGAGAAATPAKSGEANRSEAGAAAPGGPSKAESRTGENS